MKEKASILIIENNYSIVKKTFGELYANTIERENLLKQAGFNIISIWEADFNNTQQGVK